MEKPPFPVENLWILWGKDLSKIKIYFIVRRYQKQQYASIKKHACLRNEAVNQNSYVEVCRCNVQATTFLGLGMV
ncbi:MAG: hypothetical protein F6K11_37045 [Leptolyngbya sp. SIO3F4]|nr:hypothetical protein [Leptolyngbya sp. SIO3F4]